jgi:anti-sigma factor RsiW
MNNTDFNQLLNAYLDGELTRKDLELFNQALHESPARQREFYLQQRLRLAQPLAATRHPGLLFAWPSANRMHRFGTLFANAAVLVFVLGLSFQMRESVPVESLSNSAVTLSAPSSPSPRASAVPAVRSVDAMDFASYSESMTDGNTGGTDVETILPSEEYGFVRL